MFNHVMVGSNDIERSKRFYDAVLRVIGAQGEPVRNVAATGHVRLFYRHGGNTLGISQPIKRRNDRIQMRDPGAGEGVS